ncbi:MAG: hypothetical protein LBL86_08755 [Coriobacteriales bacterium]|nr:hypothetical protein [Coriobacteriales bacterium]
MYKVTLTPLSLGDASVSIWGHTGEVPAQRIGTDVTALPVNVSLAEATLTLGDGAQNVLDGITVFDEPVEVDLTYSGRSDVGDPDASVSCFYDATGNPANPKWESILDSDIAASYNPVTGKLTVTPAKSGLYKLTVTVAAAGFWGQATQDIYVTVARKALEISFTDPPEQPLRLKVGEKKTIAFTYTSESLEFGQRTSSNSAVAEIGDFSVNAQMKRGEIVIEAKEASASSVSLTIQVASDNALYVPFTLTLTVQVSKSDEALNVNPGTLALIAGESSTAQVSYDGTREITASSSNANVATVTYAAATKQLTVQALTSGTADITVAAAETDELNASTCTLRVTVDRLLSVNPDALTLKAGQVGTAEVGYGGDGEVTASSSDAKVAKVTYAAATKQLTVQALTFGTATITIRAAKTDAFDAAECTVQVTVTKDAPPSLGNLGSEYELVLGGDPWTVTYSEALQYQLVPQGIVSVTSSNGGKTLTVAAVAAGSAVLTLWAEETATTTALAPCIVAFTVKAAPPVTKPVTALDPLSLPVGATATSTVTLYDAGGKPVAGAVGFNGFDEKVIGVSYDAAASALSIRALAPGQTTLTISSEEAAEDYTMQVTVTAAADDPDDSTDDPADEPTVKLSDVQAGDTGVKITGTLQGPNIPAGATVAATVEAATSGDAYDKHLAAKGEGDILGVYEINLIVNGKEIHDGFGTLTLAFPVDASYTEGTVLVRHLHQNGKFTEHSTKVANKTASLKVTDLSTFALETQKAAATTTKASTTATTPAKTGDEAPGVMSGLAAVGAAAAVAACATRRRRSDSA